MDIGFEKISFHKHFCEKSPLDNDTVKGIYSFCIKSYISLRPCRWELMADFNGISLRSRRYSRAQGGGGSLKYRLPKN